MPSENQYGSFKALDAPVVVTAMATEYEYLLSVPDLIGKNLERWMAVVGKQIVAIGDSPREVLEKAKKIHPDKEPFIAKFPKERAMLL